MSVGVMKDYKLKQRDLGVSHFIHVELFILNHKSEN